MREGTIRFATYEALPAYKDVAVKTLRQDLPNWKQRLFVWLGDKLNAFKKDYERSVSYTVNELDMRGAFEEMMKHKANVEMLSGNRAKYLIVGRDQFQKLNMQDMAIRHLGLHSFPLMETRYGKHGELSPRKFMYDLEVVVVPYIDGCFVLPELASESTER